jgi:hypothetical protein
MFGHRGIESTSRRPGVDGVNSGEWPDIRRRLDERPTWGQAVRLAAIVAALSVLSLPVAAQETGTVSGRVVDAETGRGISGVLVVVGDAAPIATDPEGFFSVTNVPAGPRTLALSHLGYGDHADDVVVEAAAELSLTIHLSIEAIELEPFLVETFADIEEQRRRTSGHSINEIGREEIQAAARAGLALTDLLQTSMPGAMASVSGTARTCVMYRAIRSGGQTGCREVSVYVDGIQVTNPSYIYQTMPLSDIERLEMLSPGQAGMRYGTASGQAVLLIETQSGERVQRADASSFVTGFQWLEEEAPYGWGKVLGTTFVVNAAAVGASLLLADRCLWSPHVGSLGLRTRCNGLNTASIGLLSVAVPAIAGGLIAQWSGTTSRTRGRLAPTALAAGMTLTGGYLLMIQGGDHAQAAGYVVLSAGVPLTLTLADRIFRALR